jgi:hypothetical protein
MKRLLISCLGCLVLACGFITGEEEEEEITRERLIGTIEFYSDPVRIQLPGTVLRGVTFDVTVRTYGGGCIDKGDTEVEVNGLAAQVTPYDIEVTHMPAGSVCTADLRFYEHIGEVRFDQSGTATVVVRGRKKPQDVIISVERAVNVR